MAINGDFSLWINLNAEVFSRKSQTSQLYGHVNDIINLILGFFRYIFI